MRDHESEATNLPVRAPLQRDDTYVCIATVTERSHSASGNDTCNRCTAPAPERSSGCTRVMVHHRTKPKNRQISMMWFCFPLCFFAACRHARPASARPASTPQRRGAGPRHAQLGFRRQKPRNPAFLPNFGHHFVSKKSEGTRGSGPLRPRAR